jgi:hypothetical protein
MQPARQVIREFRWREIFPGLMLVRVFRCSLRIHALALSLVATLLMSSGWQAAAYLTGQDQLANRRSMEFGDMSPVGPLLRATNLNQSRDERPSIYDFHAPIRFEFERFVRPVRAFFSPVATYSQRAYLVLGFAWTLLVGAFFAGVICRTAAFDLATQERYGVFRAFRFVLLRLRYFVLAPLIPLGLLLLMLLPIYCLGLTAHYVSSFLVSLLWGLAILWGLLTAMVALMISASWPMIWPALASEDSDSFDALGNAVGYTSQRPFTFLGYAAAAALVVGVGLVVVILLIEISQSLLFFGMYAGGGVDVGSYFVGTAFKGPRPNSETANVLEIWEFIGNHFVVAFLFSSFWTSATGIFLLLRYHVDGAELDEIYRDGAQDERPMPKLAREMGLTGEAASMASPIAPAAESMPEPGGP